MTMRRRSPAKIPVRITRLGGPVRPLPRGRFGDIALGETAPNAGGSNTLIWGLGAAMLAYLAILGVMAYSEGNRTKRRAYRANDTRLR